MTPEQQLERVRMCLAEAGYDPMLVELHPRGDGFVHSMRAIPLFVAWKAVALAGAAVCCWPCRRDMGFVGEYGPARPACTHPVNPFIREDAEAVA